jgi:hypothetical protein
MSRSTLFVELSTRGFRCLRYGYMRKKENFREKKRRGERKSPFRPLDLEFLSLFFPVSVLNFLFGCPLPLSFPQPCIIPNSGSEVYRSKFIVFFLGFLFELLFEFFFFFFFFFPVSGCGGFFALSISKSSGTLKIYPRSLALPPSNTPRNASRWMRLGTETVPVQNP